VKLNDFEFLIGIESEIKTIKLIVSLEYKVKFPKSHAMGLIKYLIKRNISD
jgi:hypothetical protein